MIHIERLPEPDVLRKRKGRWLETFLAKRGEDANARPSSRQYAHREIRDTLMVMSHQKCFYCETKVESGEAEVDHYVEVAEAPERAFDWNNLYLSCHSCNSRKLPHSQIPVTECVDPCGDGDNDPKAHLTFEDEVVTAKDGSSRGYRTIQKYQLNRQDLSYRRSRALQRFEKAWRRLRERRGNGALTERDKEIIQCFGQPDRPFSLMFQVYLADAGL